MARVHVVVKEGSAEIRGYHAINLGVLNIDELKRRPPGSESWGDPGVFLGQVVISYNLAEKS